MFDSKFSKFILKTYKILKEELYKKCIIIRDILKNIKI